MSIRTVTRGAAAAALLAIALCLTACGPDDGVTSGGGSLDTQNATSVQDADPATTCEPAPGAVWHHPLRSSSEEDDRRLASQLGIEVEKLTSAYLIKVTCEDMLDFSKLQASDALAVRVKHNDEFERCLAPGSEHPDELTAAQAHTKEASVYCPPWK